MTEAKAGYFRPLIPTNINIESLMENLRFLTPLSIDHNYYIDDDERAALFVVDVLNGFCKPGCGPLAPPSYDRVMEEVIMEAHGLAVKFDRSTGKFIIVTRDCHDPSRPEKPFLIHCEKGTEQAELVDQLAWLDNRADLQIYKECFSSWVGADVPNSFYPPMRCNQIENFIYDNKIKVAVLVGVCTDICIFSLVHSLLSARNAGLLPTLEDVVVYVPGCMTFDLPLEACRALDLPESAAHPREPLQYMGLNLMMLAGATLVDNIILS